MFKSTSLIPSSHKDNSVGLHWLSEHPALCRMELHLQLAINIASKVSNLSKGPVTWKKFGDHCNCVFELWELSHLVKLKSSIQNTPYALFWKCRVLLQQRGQSAKLLAASLAAPNACRLQLMIPPFSHKVTWLYHHVDNLVGIFLHNVLWEIFGKLDYLQWHSCGTKCLVLDISVNECHS